MKIRLAFIALLTCIVATAAAPRKILFIGNSLTYFQDGIYTHLEKLTASANPPVVIQAEKSVQGGATLKTLWEKAEPRELIGKGRALSMWSSCRKIFRRSMSPAS